MGCLSYGTGIVLSSVGLWGSAGTGDPRTDPVLLAAAEEWG